MMPADTEDALKVKPIFQAPTKQSKLITYFPGKQTSFLPPVKRRQEDRMKEGLLVDKEPVNDNIEKANKRLKTNHQEVRIEVEETILISSNDEEVERLLSGCKELVFLLVFMEGFTQFRDTMSLGSGFGSPLGVVVRVEGQEGKVFFFRAELWRQSCPS